MIISSLSVTSTIAIEFVTTVGMNTINIAHSVKKIKRKQRKAVVDESTKAQRESIALSCISHASRESNPDRAYLDEQSWYTTCPAPFEGDSDYIASPASFANYSSPENESYLHL